MLEVGWASQDMTPVRPAMLLGQTYRRVGSQAMDPLTMTAMALREPQSGDCAVVGCMQKKIVAMLTSVS